MADDHATSSAPLSPPKKRLRKPFSVSDKESIMNIYKASEKNNPEFNKVQKVQFTSEAAGVSVTSVYNILKEYSDAHEFHAPKTYHRMRAVLDNIDDQTKCIIRRTIHSFFLRNEPPTVKKILAELATNEAVPNFKDTVFRKLLKEMGFRYTKRCRDSMLKEKYEIISWRRRYLRSIKKIREENKTIYYLDETWVNAGHVVQKVWKDTTLTTAREAFVKGLSPGLTCPSGKGKRLIVLHIGSNKGFVDEGLLVFESKKTVDYHEEMNSQVFEKWFEKILPRLDENAVIVMDNASYHSRKTEKIPTSATRKADIQSWLENKNIAYEQDMVKAELLDLVKANHAENKYYVDELAKSTGRSVLRLPPYHCELNPIELIWAQVKNEVARENTTFKFCDLQPLFDKALKNVTPENWKKAIDHILKEELRMWTMDAMMEDQVEPLIINVDNDSSSSEFESD